MKEVRAPVHFKSERTNELTRVYALVDSGATENFIDKDLVSRHQLPKQKLSYPIEVLNIDGTKNHHGSTTHVVDLEFYIGNHKETPTLGIASIGKNDIILGSKWLEKHNPSIDWHHG